MTKPSPLSQPLALASGRVLRNRLVKAATEEGLADRAGLPTAPLIELYRRHGTGGAGLLVTGGVCIRRDARGRPRDVVIEDWPARDPFRRWADAARSSGAAILMQLQHSGRQTPRMIARQPVAPSAVPAVKLFRSFGAPRAMSEAEVRDTIERFAAAAAFACECGFDGVQIHAAHGYLLSQFLSPLTNRRDDAWGGDLDRRLRIIVEVIRATRARIGPGRIIALKLNTFDLARDGVSVDDFVEICQRLGDQRIDLLEISGGTHEASMYDARVVAPDREGYFLEGAERARRVMVAARTPVLVTGGLRSRAVMEAILERGRADLIGLARPLVLDPGAPGALLAGTCATLDAPRIGGRRGGALGALQNLAWYATQLRRVAHGREPARWLTGPGALVRYLARDHRDAWRDRRQPPLALVAGEEGR